MKYLFFTALLLAISAPLTAHAEFGYGSTEITSPKSMVVAGNSVIDDSGDTPATAQVVKDDAEKMMKPGTTPPVIEDINPFTPAPEVQTPQNVKKVVKKIPVVKVKRSIADDRIDDGYVQQMIKKNLDYTNPIE